MDMDKQDLTGYGDQELSMMVMNDEPLYRQFMRCQDKYDLLMLVDPCFIYTPDQFAELENDLELESE